MLHARRRLYDTGTGMNFHRTPRSYLCRFDEHGLEIAQEHTTFALVQVQVNNIHI